MTLAYFFSDQFLGDPPEGGNAESRPSGLRGERALQNAVSPAEVSLVLRIRAGDAAAFRELYVVHVQSLIRFARRFVHAPEGATDVVQDVFMALWTRRDVWEVTGSVRAYLYGAVRRRALAVLRDAKVASRAIERGFVGGEGLGIGNTAVNQAQRVEDDELIAAIEQAIALLPERQRTAVLLRWNDEMNAAEISRVLGISDTAVRKLLLAARRRIALTLPRRD